MRINGLQKGQNDTENNIQGVLSRYGCISLIRSHPFPRAKHEQSTGVEDTIPCELDDQWRSASIPSVSIMPVVAVAPVGHPTLVLCGNSGMHC